MHNQRDVFTIVLIGIVNFGEGPLERFFRVRLLPHQAGGPQFKEARFSLIQVELEKRATSGDFRGRLVEMEDGLAHNRIQALVGQSYLGRRDLWLQKSATALAGCAAQFEQINEISLKIQLQPQQDRV